MTFRTETIGDCRLILGDCLEVLPTLGNMDAVVTDPPYGCSLIAKEGRIGSHTSKAGIKGRIYHPVQGDDSDFDPSPFLGFPVVVMFGGNWFCSRLPDASCWLVWDKRNGTAGNNMADVELAWTNLPGPARILHHRWMGMIRDSEKRSDERVHPTQKPIAVMEWCLHQLPEHCQTILDPFMGSGTTGVACVKLGRKFIGVEIEERYFQIACERIYQATRQPRLDLPEPSKPEQVPMEGI